jgi:hypothetical protein
MKTRLILCVILFSFCQLQAQQVAKSVTTDKKFNHITPFYYTENPAWNASGKYEPFVSSFVELSGDSYVIQTINLTAGWNIVSFYVIPDNLDIKSIFGNYINDGSLVKVQDETGNSLEDFGLFGGWNNAIGLFDVTKGYKVKVTRNCQLIVQGIPVVLPIDIPFSAGWKIIGYPIQKETNGMVLVQPLINRKTLVKVQDQKGNAIEDWGVFGGWTNNIGNFKPGEGYRIKVISNDKITISESGQLQVPTLKTALPDSITVNAVVLGGEITGDGGSSVTERGVCYGTTQSPTIAGSKVTMGSGTGTFKGKVTGLTPNTTYYARAFAINSVGTAYGDQVTFTTDKVMPGVYRGIVKRIEISFCMDGCGRFTLVPDPGYQGTNLYGMLDQYVGLHVEVRGSPIWCVECGALEVTSIIIL